MAGVVVNDSLVLVDHLNQLTRRGSASNMKALVASGTADRLRPVLLTTLTTVAGLLPLAYGIGGEDTSMGPMAFALGYGLLFATPITLVLLPSLYMIGYDLKGLFGKAKEGLSRAVKKPE
jgi:multidrug efflux pump subunit AcrB